MAELTFRSPGVTATEIDLTAPTTTGPTGIPAGVIGTANEGPAFVPITLADYRSFSQLFGATDGQKFGPLAVYEFLKNAKALTYLKVLGSGDCKKRADSGAVTNAGFTVGSKLVQDNGVIGANPYANTDGDEGRAWFLGALMKDSISMGYTSSLFSGAGLQTNVSASAIIRGVIMAASGVIPLLSSSANNRSSAPAAAQSANISGFASALKGEMTGSVKMSTSQFVLLMNGFKPTISHSNVITASFDTQASDYFANILNTDPEKIQERGHYLYAHYDIHSALGTLTGSGWVSESLADSKAGANQTIAFITTGALARNAGGTYVPNYESFTDRFKTPKSPFVISQDYGGTKYNLFRVHAVSDGTVSNSTFKTSIENLKPSTSEAAPFGSFDLIVRSFTDTDDEPQPVEEFRGMNLDPSSDRYVGRVVGDQKMFFDFDQPTGAQKLVLEGDHPVNSNFIRVELSSQLRAG